MDLINLCKNYDEPVSDDSVAALMPQSKNMSRKEILDSICPTICPIKKFIGAPNYLLEFDPIPDDDGNYKLNGQNATIVDRKDVGSGKEGTVYNITMQTEDGQKAQFAVKVYSTDIRDDIIFANKYSDKLTDCPGIVPMKVGKLDKEMVLFMPLADGDFTHFVNGGLTPSQAENVIMVIWKTLVCLSKHGLYYFDIKPDNIVFHCKDALNSTIYLVDLSSCIPILSDDDDTSRTYISTYPPPVDARSQFVPLLGYIEIGNKPDNDLIFQIYTYQLSLLYGWFITPSKNPPQYIDVYDKVSISEYFETLRAFIIDLHGEYGKDFINGKYGKSLMSVMNKNALSKETLGDY
jgi:serine/threonine protein kinase